MCVALATMIAINEAAAGTGTQVAAAVALQIAWSSARALEVAMLYALSRRSGHAQTRLGIVSSVDFHIESESPWLRGSIRGQSLC